MYELLLGLGLLINASSTEVPMPPECNDPEVIGAVIELSMRERFPDPYIVRIDYAYPTEPPEPSIGLRSCQTELHLSSKLVSGSYYRAVTFELQTINYPEYVVRITGGLEF